MATIAAMPLAAAFRRLLGLDWRDHLAAWNERGPRDAAARWGRLLAAVGVSAFGLGVAFKIAAMTIPLGLVVLGLAMARAPAHRMPGFWPLVALLAWALLSGLVSPLEDPWGGFGYLYVALALPLLCCALAARPWALRWTTIGALTGLLVHSLLATLQFTVGMDKDAVLQLDPDGQRFHYAPGWRQRNVGPAMYAGAMLLVAWHSRPGEYAPSALQWVARVAGLGAVLMTKARSAILALCAALVGAFATSWRRALVGALAAILLGSAGLGLMYLRSPDRVHKLLTLDDPRWAYWRLGAHDIQADPWFGRGGQRAFRDGVEKRWVEVNPEERFDPVLKYNLHNTPLNYAAFHGLPAGVFHLLFLLAIGLACWRASRQGGLAFSAWCYVVVCGMFDATWSAQTTAYPFALALALCLAPGAGGMAGQVAARGGGETSGGSRAGEASG